MISPGGWLQQHHKVRRIEGRTVALRRQALQYRRQTRAWFARIGSPELMAWSFAAGLVWASGHARSSGRHASGGAVMRLSNIVLLAWQFLHRVRVVGAALGLDPLRAGGQAQPDARRTE